MSKVTMLKGLPASGKSTWAREESEAQDAIRVNKDDLRLMLHNGVWNKGNEKVTLWMRDAIIKEGLKRKLHVIVDDTNIQPTHEKQIRKIAAGHHFSTKTFLDVPLEELYARDEQRGVDGGVMVGRDVINRMWKEYQKFKDAPPQEAQPMFLPVEQNLWLPPAIIVDIDGTLADHDGRSPYDWKRVGQDKPISPVCDLVRLLIPHFNILFFSGRDGSCREETWKWLQDNVIGGYEKFCKLYMRPAGDQRKDDIIKSELLENHALGKWYVQFVIDDRKQVKRMWNQRGLFVFDVNQTDEEF